jgi:PadR family transcriptional regulator, regulatory protein PadR
LSSFGEPGFWIRTNSGIKKKGVDNLQADAVDCLHPIFYEHLREKKVKAKKQYENSIELLQGTLDLLILQTLQWGPRHGYGISQAIRTGSSEVLQVDTGSLYPALHRLERKKWIKAEWTTSDNNQQVKSYQLTAAGKKQLLAERSNWDKLSAAMAGILHPAGQEGE